MSVLVVVVLVLTVGEGVDRYWDHSGDLGPDFSVVVQTRSAAELPPSFETTSKRPTPGFEEIGAPLAMAPVLTTTSTAYAFMGTQLGPTGETVPVAWSPCRPIHFVVDPTGAPDDFVDQVVASFGAVSMATGLIFVYDGLTQEPTTPERAAFQPTVYGDRWAPVLVQLADETTYPELEGNVAGLASTQSVEERPGLTYFITGAIHIDTTLLDQPGQRGIPPYVPVLRHELGHLVGLDHIGDSSQLMHPSSGGVATFQTGDLTGLAELGQGACAPSL
ncbi:peptidase [Cellulomonas sp. KRMCY2]|uniref:peptidase n=1 Tax=Cellulomonas sp. KRMCY2 TaxID=1304865 RepID=UPI0012DD4E5C|nr:peptidase [Cellulomonas sp. KRMCY2]